MASTQLQYSHPPGLYNAGWWPPPSSSTATHLAYTMLDDGLLPAPVQPPTWLIQCWMMTSTQLQYSHPPGLYSAGWWPPPSSSTATHLAYTMLDDGLHPAPIQPPTWLIQCWMMASTQLQYSHPPGLYSARWWPPTSSSTDTLLAYTMLDDGLHPAPVQPIIWLIQCWVMTSTQLQYSHPPGLYNAGWWPPPSSSTATHQAYTVLDDDLHSAPVQPPTWLIQCWMMASTQLQYSHSSGLYNAGWWPPPSSSTDTHLAYTVLDDGLHPAPVQTPTRLIQCWMMTSIQLQYRHPPGLYSAGWWPPPSSSTDTHLAYTVLDDGLHPAPVQTPTWLIQCWMMASTQLQYSHPPGLYNAGWWPPPSSSAATHLAYTMLDDDLHPAPVQPPTWLIQYWMMTSTQLQYSHPPGLYNAGWWPPPSSSTATHLAYTILDDGLDPAPVPPPTWLIQCWMVTSTQLQYRHPPGLCWRMTWWSGTKLLRKVTQC